MEVLNDYGDSNSMLSQMEGRNEGIAQHNKDIQDRLDTTRTLDLQRAGELKKDARAERGAPVTPTKLGTYAAQLGQTAGSIRNTMNGARSVGVGTYMKNLGRTGDETTFGVRPAIRGARQVGQAIQSARSDFQPRVVSSVSYEGSAPPSNLSADAMLDHQGGETFQPRANAVSDALSREGGGQSTSAIADPSAPRGPVSGGGATVASASEGGASTGASTGTASATGASAGEAGASAGASTGGDTIGAVKAGVKTGASAEDAIGSMTKVGKLVSKAGDVGTALGVVGGVASGIQDIVSGKIVGDDTGEKVGNVLSVASGTMDALSMAMPIFAPFGALFGIASAVSNAVGEENEAKKTEGDSQTKTQDAAKAKPQGLEDTQTVSSLASMGKITSASTDSVHTITGGASAY